MSSKASPWRAPYVKLVCMGRSIMTAAMVGTTEGKKLAEKCAAGGAGQTEGRHLETFAEASNLRRKYGREFARIPAGAIGMYSYISRMTQGLQQFMAGARKFALKYITRDDLVALTEEAAEFRAFPMSWTRMPMKWKGFWGIAANSF